MRMQSVPGSLREPGYEARATTTKTTGTGCAREHLKGGTNDGLKAAA